MRWARGRAEISCSAFTFWELDFHIRFLCEVQLEPAHVMYLACRNQPCTREGGPGGSRGGWEPAVKAPPWLQVLLVPPVLPAAGAEAGLPAREAASAAGGVCGWRPQV